MKYLKEARTALISAVVVFVLMQWLVDIVTPYLPLLVGAVVVITVVWVVFARVTRL